MKTLSVGRVVFIGFILCTTTIGASPQAPVGRAAGAGLRPASFVLPPDPPPGVDCSAQCSGVSSSDPIVDVLLCGAVGNGTTDDTGALTCAAYMATGRVLWIPKGYNFVVNQPLDASGLGGLNIRDRTTVTGGGTLKFSNGTAGTRLLHIRHRTDVLVTDLVFDGNASFNPIPPQPISDCTNRPHDDSEYRRAIGIEESTGVTVTNCVFRDLTGDGISISDDDTLGVGQPTGNPSKHILVQGNRFTGNYTSRTGVGVICAEDVRIQNNHFENMGRSCMPGPIDLEVDYPIQSIKDVVISGNEMSGKTGCENQSGISMSNVRGGKYRNIVIADNTIHGCFQAGIGVMGVGNGGEYPVTITGNSIFDITGTPAAWDAGITAFNTDSLALVPCPASAYPSTVLISGNTIRSVSKGPGIALWDADAVITGNYVVDAQTWGIDANSCSDQRGVTIADNRLSDCGDATDDNHGGIRVRSNDGVITGNLITSTTPGRTKTGIYVPSGSGNLITGNVTKGIGAYNVHSEGGTQNFGVNHGTWNAYPPTDGYCEKGYIVPNPDPKDGDPIGWVCAVSGTPGSWVPFGLIKSPAALTTDDEWNSATKINSRIMGNGEKFATINGSEKLTMKDLTDSTNIFPQTGVVAFICTPGSNATLYCGPNNGLGKTVVSQVSVPMLPLTLKSMACTSSATPGKAGAGWTMTILKNGVPVSGMSCPIVEPVPNCTSTGTASFANKDELALRVTKNGTPSTAAVVKCSAGVYP